MIGPAKGSVWLTPLPSSEEIRKFTAFEKDPRKAKQPSFLKESDTRSLFLELLQLDAGLTSRRMREILTPET